MLAALRGVQRSSTMLARFASSTPTVYDRMYADMGVNITVVDLQGHRHSLRGLSGQTVADVMREQSDALGRHLSGRVVTGNNYEGHIKIPTELFARFPLTDAQREILEDIALPGTVDAHSRLASTITLETGFEPLMVAVSEIGPWKSV